MVNFRFDQAEGLRRMAAGPKPRICTMLSAVSPEEKLAALTNLAWSLARIGSDVLLLDARAHSAGIARHLGSPLGASLLEAAHGDVPVQQLAHSVMPGLELAALTRGALPPPARHAALESALGKLIRNRDVLLADAELGQDGSLPLEALTEGEIVVLVANNAESIKQAYALIKRRTGGLGRCQCGILVTGATEQEAQLVYANLARTASRYLAVQLHSAGFLPEDEQRRRAMHLNRPVVDIFPLAASSVAFRRLAARFTPHDVFRDACDVREADLAAAGA